MDPPVCYRLTVRNLVQEVESGLTTPGLSIWANPGFFMWRSNCHNPTLTTTMDTKPSTAMPSLKPMEAANRLLKKADAMDPQRDCQANGLLPHG